MFNLFSKRKLSGSKNLGAKIDTSGQKSGSLSPNSPSTAASHYSPMSPQSPIDPNYRPTFSPRGSSHPQEVFKRPPKKVIKANRDYYARFMQELSFRKGDFFYVIGDGHVDHYEVMNPAEKKRGLVPKFCFDSLEKIQKSPNDQEPIYDDDYSYLQELYDDKPRFEQQIESISVQNVELKSDKQYWFTVEVKRTETRQVLQRTYHDFWALQVSLLNFFPVESGRKGKARVIPFMQPPSKDWTSALAQQRKVELDAYLQELIKLPLQSSQPILKFFALKSTDIETLSEIGFDVSATLMDLITEYNEAGEVYITIVTQDREQDILVPNTASIDDLYNTIENALDMYVPGLAYADECNELVPLVGDKDLGLLFRTNLYNMVLYVVESLE